MNDATATAPAGKGPFLGWRAQRRPVPGFAHVLGAVAGAFVVIAMVAFVVAIDDTDPQTPGVVLSLVVIAAALALGALGRGPLRSAAATMLVGAVPLLWVFAIFGDEAPERGDVRALLLLTLVTFTAIYLLAWTRGRTVFLALALVLLVVWVAFEVAGDNSSLFGSTSVPSLGNGPAIGNGPASFDDTSNATRTAVMLLGFGYLVVGGLLDRARLKGAATPFLVIGALSAIGAGVSLAGEESQFLGGLVAVLIGAAVGLLGAAGRERRGTTWLGLATVFGGAVAILEDISPDEAEGVGGIALAFALVLGALAWWLAPVLNEPDDGNEPEPAVPGVPPSDATGVNTA